jgi:hypothetical protein|tara:strand:- start:453 stop:869 length:417 start_codon:yes stop_codon:yes gene_type:complete
MEVFLFILSFMSGGVILTVAYTTHLTNATKAKQDKLAFLQEEMLGIQKKQFSGYGGDQEKTLLELIEIRSMMEGDSYRDLVSTNQRISKFVTRLDILTKDVGKMNRENREIMANMGNDIQNRMATMEKLIGNELKQNY